jgi:NAD-dependent SIR2 family protein deacetylase
MQALMWKMMLTLNSHAKKDGNYHKVNQINKGIVYFKIFHQNIRGLGKKAGELLSHLHPDFPHVLCLTEHHQKCLQLEKVHIENYKLGAHYCRRIHEKGGVAIFVHNNLNFSIFILLKIVKNKI